MFDILNNLKCSGNSKIIVSWTWRSVCRKIYRRFGENVCFSIVIMEILSRSFDLLQNYQLISLINATYTGKVYRVSWTLLLAHSSTRIVKIVAILATSQPCLMSYFHGVSWRRFCSLETHPTNLRWEECSLSCAEGLKKTCVAISLRTCVFGFKNVVEEMVATSST